MSGPTIIANLGKGGAGKTILSALCGKLAIARGKKTLFVDADPAQGLSTALGEDGARTIGEAREEIIRQAKQVGKSPDAAADLGDQIDYLLLQTLQERDGYGLLVMGRTQTIGCYCPVNRLLKDAIRAIAAHYDVLIIDAEAGIEQVNRQVVETVHYPLVITDNSLRGAKTALLVQQAIAQSETMAPRKTGVIFNRVDQPDPALQQMLESAGLAVYGSIPADPLVTERDRRGLSPLQMPPEAVSLQAIARILTQEGIL